VAWAVLRGLGRHTLSGPPRVRALQA